MTPSVDEAAHRAATSDLNLIRKPSRAQSHAGNYAMGHMRVAGLDITIENPAGSKRRPEWPPMKDHYGYVRGSVGADGDHVDVFVKPGISGAWNGSVYVVDQFRPDGVFDEHKCMVGYNSAGEASEAYLSNYQAGWRLGPVTTMALPAFKAWVKSEAATAPLSGSAYSKVDLAALIKYSDDEPRDDSGKWTDGGGSAFDAGAAKESIGRLDTIAGDFGGAISGPNMAKDPAVSKLAMSLGTAPNRVVHQFTRSWNTSSQSPLSNLMQQAAAEEFGQKDASPVPEYKGNKAEIGLASDVGSEKVPARDDVVAAMRSTLRSMYDATQAKLASAGITDVYVMRGTRREMSDGALHASLRPLSSFTTNEDTARDFAGTGSVIVTKLPAGRILSTGSTGLGDSSEHEVVVLGGKIDAIAFKGDEPGSWTSRVNTAFGKGVIDLDETEADWIRKPKKVDLARLRKYSDDEPRDDNGRWTASAGSDGNPSGGFHDGYKPPVPAPTNGLKDTPTEPALPFGRQPALPKKEETLLAFHGTSAENAVHIREVGLIPKGGAGGDAWAQKHGFAVEKMLAGDRAQSVYITPRKETAKRYANLAATMSGSQPVILELHVPKSAQGQFMRDEQDPYGIRTLKPIPASWIGDHYYQLTPDGSYEEKLLMHKAADGTVTYYIVVLADGGDPKTDLTRVLKGDVEGHEFRGNQWTGGMGGGGATEARMASHIGMGMVGGSYQITNPGAFARAVKEYNARPDSQGGKVLNTDIARELSKDYLKDRTKSADVHEPASAFIKALYAQKLAEPTEPGQRKLVLFTAGGTGAGKSTGLTLPEVSPIVSSAHIIYDTNMNTYGSAAQKVDQAIAAGHEATIVYVGRDPVDALVNGALPRAMRQEQEFGSGRTVPLDEHLKTHIGALDTVKKLQSDYASSGKLHVIGVNNSLGKGGARVEPIANFKLANSSDLYGKLNEALDQQYQAGKISPSVYAGFKASGRTKPEGMVGKSSAGDGRGDQQKDRQKVNLLALLKGDVEGHEFHGNQWTGGMGEGSPTMHALFDRISAPDGGFTYSPSTNLEPSGGYALSIHPDRSAAFDADKIKFSDLAHYAAKNRDLLSQPGNHIGAWHDPESHKVFLDVSMVTNDKAEAERLALQHDQIAYFDLNTFQSVTVNAHATSGGTVGKYAKARTTSNADLRVGLRSRSGSAGAALGKADGQQADAGGTGLGARRDEGARKGDLPGHEFRGNQWTGGTGSGDRPSSSNGSGGAQVPGIALTGIHYSRQPRAVLDTASYGTGMRGGETRRVANADDPRLKQRAYFYVDTGSGVKPEDAVGGVKHTAQLTNIYDPATDNHKIWNEGHGDANDSESAVLNHGYSGYYVHNNPVGGNPQGAVVMLGPQKIPVQVTKMLTSLLKAWISPTSATSGIQPYDGAKARVQHQNIDDAAPHKKKRKPRRKPRPSLYRRPDGHHRRG